MVNLPMRGRYAEVGGTLGSEESKAIIYSMESL